MSLDMTQALPPNQYKIIASKVAPIQQPGMEGAYHLSFMPEDVVILANPTGCLNNVCINRCIALLFSLIKPPDADRFAVFLMHDLPHIQYNGSDESLWRGTWHTMFWTKDTWILPIHRPSPVGHWVLCIAHLPHRELCLFDSLAEEKGWPADIEVCTYSLPHYNNTNFVSDRVL